MWAATGGYEAISREVFPRLTNLDRLLLEYDTDRAGGFAPLADVLPHHQVVLGLVTTKDGTLEDADDVVARIEEATEYVPLDRLAVSPQCGFASGEIARTMTWRSRRRSCAWSARSPAGSGAKPPLEPQRFSPGGQNLGVGPAMRAPRRRPRR